MLESVKKISNPLTVISIFAGLAEISGTAVLPILAPDSQSTYVWFLMGFPTFLITLFFATLNFNHKVLYAPSDFKDEDNFLKLFAKPTPEERLEKLSIEIEGEQVAQSEEKAVPNEQKSNLQYREVIRRNLSSIHYLAEELVLTKLSKEFEEINKEVMLRSGNSQFLFDAIAKKGKRLYAVEVKYLKGKHSIRNVRSSLVKIKRTLSELPSNSVEPMTVVLAIATDCEGEELFELNRELNATVEAAQFPCEVRVYNLAVLEAELLGG